MRSIMLNILDALRLPPSARSDPRVFIVGKPLGPSIRMCSQRSKGSLAGVTSRQDAVDPSALAPLRFGECVVECPIPTPTDRVLMMRSLTSHILDHPLAPWISGALVEWIGLTVVRSLTLPAKPSI